MPQFSVSLDKVVEKLRLEVVYTPTELKNIPIYTADVIFAYQVYVGQRCQLG